MRYRAIVGNRVVVRVPPREGMSASVSRINTRQGSSRVFYWLVNDHVELGWYEAHEFDQPLAASGGSAPKPAGDLTTGSDGAVTPDDGGSE